MIGCFAADFLFNSGITTVIDAQHAIAHNKVILIDGLTFGRRLYSFEAFANTGGNFVNSNTAP